MSRVTQLTDSLNATRAELAETTIELQAERLVASQERSHEVQEWRQRHKQVEENLLEALRNQSRVDKKTASRRPRFGIRVQSITRGKARRVFERFRARRYLSRGLEVARREEGAEEKEKLIGHESVEALRRLEKTWRSILITVDRVEKQVHAVYSSRRSYTVFSRELRGLDRILEGLRPRYEKAQTAFELLKERAQGRAGGKQRGAGVATKAKLIGERETNEAVVGPTKRTALAVEAKTIRNLADMRRGGKRGQSSVEPARERHLQFTTRQQKRLGSKKEAKPFTHYREVSCSSGSVSSNGEEREDREAVDRTSKTLERVLRKPKKNKHPPEQSGLQEGSSYSSDGRYENL